MEKNKILPLLSKREILSGTVDSKKPGLKRFVSMVNVAQTPTDANHKEIENPNFAREFSQFAREFSQFAREFSQFAREGGDESPKQQ